VPLQNCLATLILTQILSHGILAVAVLAQDTKGWSLVSSFRDPVLDEDGGLWFVHPITPGAPIPVTGLGDDLTGAGSSDREGANCVLVDRGDGALLVGEAGPSGTRIDLHVIYLSGTAVLSDTLIKLGTETSPFGGGITQIALLPAGRVLAGVFGIGLGPLKDQLLGVVDRSDGSVVGVPVSFPNGATPALNALCISADGATAWFAMDNGDFTSTLYSVPVPAGGTANVHDTLPVLVSSLILDRSRGLLCASGLEGTQSGNILEIDPESGVLLDIVTTGMTRLNGMCNDYARHRSMTVTSSLGSPSRTVSAVEWDGSSTSLAVVSGSASGVDLSALALAANPTQVHAGETLSLLADGGVPSTTSLLAAVSVNGTPVFLALALGALDFEGAWNLLATVPPGLSGTSVTFQSFGFFHSGKALGTNLAPVIFQ